MELATPDIVSHQGLSAPPTGLKMATLASVWRTKIIDLSLPLRTQFARTIFRRKSTMD